LAQNFPFAGLSTIRVAFRSRMAPERSIAAVRAVIRSIDPELPLIQAQTVKEQMSALLTAQQMGATILGALSALGMVLALFGLYGVVSYSVARRTHELGVRIALGAGTANVLRLTLGEGMRPVLVGAGAGVALVLVLSKAAASFMYGVNARDPLTLALATLLLLLVAAGSVLVPARRATRIEPTQALREE
jgi:ABC-type antimicrobial peptide transport system permease subunit